MAEDEGKQLLAAAKVVLKQAKDRFRTSVPAYERCAKTYQTAIDGKASPEELDFYRDEFEKALAKLNDAMASTQGVLRYVKKMRETGTTDAGEVAAMLKDVAPIRTKLLKLIEEARTLEKEGLTSRDAADNAAGELDADLASLKDKVKDVLDDIGADPLGQAQKLRTAIDKGFDEKKQDAVTKARLALIAMDGKISRLKSTEAEVNAYKKRLANDDRDRHRESQYLLDDLFKVTSDGPKVRAIMEEQVKRGQVPKAGAGGSGGGSGKPPPKLTLDHAKKVAAKIKVTDAKQFPKILKVMNDFPVSDWPKQLARQVGVKEADVKAAMREIEKIPGVGDAKQLIDH